MSTVTLTQLAEQNSLTPQERSRVDEIKKSLDLRDSQTPVLFGTGAQRNISEFSDSILSAVRAADGGQAGELLTELVLKVKDLDLSSPGEDGGILDKIPFLNTAKSKVERLLVKYEKLKVQIDQIQAKLDQARMEMLKDISMFDAMYDKNLEYFRELNIYITAGEEKVQELTDQDLPRLRQEAAASSDPMAAQLVHDFEENVMRLDKKVHELKISRTIALQTAPQIRLIQNNDRLLVDKIQTAVLNTIPVWKSQVVIALGLARQQKVLKMQQEISDTTNELLTRNSELLKSNTVQTAREAQRSVVDVESLKTVNANLIQAIEETLKIQKEGREKRLQAEQELLKAEQELKQTLKGGAL